MEEILFLFASNMNWKKVTKIVENKKSKDYYLKLIEQNPEDSDAHNCLAIILEDEEKDFVGAKEHYLKAIKANPYNELPYYSLSNLLFDQFHDMEGGIEYHISALKLISDKEISYLNQAFIYETYKKYDKAKELYLKVLKIAPENETARSSFHNLLKHENKL